jgi:L-ribulose-5-phosphate 3-epimerase
MLPRRDFLTLCAGTAVASAVPGSPAVQAEEQTVPSAPSGPKVGSRPRHPIGVSTYSFWRFQHDEWRPIAKCLEAAAEMGFDGVEILQRQLVETTPEALNEIKRQAQSLGLPLMGFSTHQGFVTPDAEKRKKNIDLTVTCLEQAYQLGIPTMRVNSGTWGTRKDFDDLMAHRGMEEPLPGHSDDEGFGWVIDAYRQLAVEAGRRGVVMGLENHWGLGRTPEGVRRIVEAVDSPWLRVTLDTGNFLEDPYAKLAALAPQCVLLQAKTYFGGGQWYELDLDYGRIAEVFRQAGYRGWVSLEFEGKAPIVEGVRKSLELLRTHFG